MVRVIEWVREKIFSCGCDLWEIVGWREGEFRILFYFVFNKIGEIVLFEKINNYSKIIGNIGKVRIELINYICKYILKIKYF